MPRGLFGDRADNFSEPLQQMADRMRPRVVTVLPPESEEQTSLSEYARERGDWLARCAFMLTGDRDSALDLVQETLLLAWKARARVDQADDRDAYILRIMMNRHRSNHRRRQPALVSFEYARDGVLFEPDRTERVDDAAAVSAALKLLPARQRIVVVLRYWMDLDDLRISEVLDCRRATVRSLAARGMQRIKQYLEST
ncbi:RNA polymerase subunit sigma-24 [Nocardioides baekrokdamisoli]|uniref:RNA polymerase sigma factor n=1 Tax=Nocardioides baekrokdamisoli TaxID=1804624 RepID=A0A3G9IWD9_9ACTN|nr:sigma-70 family RNA polymerase sigma factor [Nocardioides baekrokdamisoli]BBH18011.1 RNA polymerase subunit sigma-24 [Nocardioides baekrokdamisoli]